MLDLGAPFAILRASEKRDGEQTRERACASCVSRDRVPRRADWLLHSFTCTVYTFGSFLRLVPCGNFDVATSRDIDLSLLPSSRGARRSAGSLIRREANALPAYRFTINDFPEFAVNGNPPVTPPPPPPP